MGILGVVSMSDFFVAALIVLVLASVSNFANPSAMSPSCKPGQAWIEVC